MLLTSSYEMFVLSACPVPLALRNLHANFGNMNLWAKTC